MAPRSRTGGIRSASSSESTVQLSSKPSRARKIQPEKAGKGKCENSPQSEDSEDRDKCWRFFGVSGVIQDLIFARLGYKQLYQARVVCKVFKARFEGCGFRACRASLHPREALLTALHFSVRHDGVWRCAGYDLITNSWMKLPPFAILPRLDPKLFKDHLICAAGGMMCVYVSAMSSLACQEKIIVFNPLTGRFRELPSLKHPRSPVLMHMVVNPAGDSFKVVVVGSARVGDEHLSRLTEVFDSHTSTWTVTQDLPGPLAALNEYQTGAYVDGVLYCIAFQDGDLGKGILAYNVEKGKWLPDLSCPLPNAKNLSIVQVANINDEVVVFSEIEHNPYNPHSTVEHRIDVLESVVDTNSAQLGVIKKWRNLVTETKLGSQAGLQTYPEYTCLPFGKGKMCMFNTMSHTGVIYDMQNGQRTGNLNSPTWNSSGDVLFHSMNPLTFTFEPSFKGHQSLQLTHGLRDKVNFLL